MPLDQLGYGMLSYRSLVRAEGITRLDMNDGRRRWVALYGANRKVVECQWFAAGTVAEL